MYRSNFKDNLKPKFNKLKTIFTEIAKELGVEIISKFQYNLYLSNLNLTEIDIRKGIIPEISVTQWKKYFQFKN